MQKTVNFLSGLKMTVVSFIFLLLSGICLLFRIETPFDLCYITVLISGIPIVYYAFCAVFKNKKITVPVLITIAMISALLTGESFAAAEVAFIMVLGWILEDITIERANKGITKLLNLAPKNARKPDNTIIDAKEIKEGDIIKVLAGEEIPVDGVITKGQTSINQSLVTGESSPVDKKEGDEVFSGTTNCFGVIEVKASKSYENSTVQKLIKLTKEAKDKKAPTQRIADKWAGILIPCALVFAIIVYLVTGDVSRAVTILVVFCPCSLVLATPTSIMAAIGQATKNGVVVKSGETLEIAGKCDIFAFDKTGTVTNGNLSVLSVEAFSDVSAQDILYYAASTELESEHPIGKAIVDYANGKNYKLDNPVDYKLASGKGIYGKINSKRIFAGTEKFFEDNDIEISAEVKKQINTKRLDGKIGVLIAIDKQTKGMIILGDTVKKSAPDAIKYLNSIGAKTVLLTGDNSFTADYFAKKIGIQEVHSGLLPKDKSDLIEKFKSANHKIAMTGDGINDAIALTCANIGISMGKFGSDIAVENSDIILTGDDLGKISYLVKLSKECIKTIKINITFAMCVNFITLTMSALGFLNPLSGAVIHNIVSVTVILNAALLYERKII